MFIEVPKVKTENFKVSEDYSKAEDSKTIKERVETAYKKQINRFKDTKITFNSEMSTREINKFCKIDDETDKILKIAVNNLNLSARAYFRILKLSRTIADLDWVDDIKKEHILEALSYRKSEK